MNFHALPSFIGGIANFVLGIFVYCKGRENKVNKIFALLCSVIAFWNIHEYGLYIAPSKVFALSWAKIFGLGLMLIPAVFLHFTLVFVGNESKKNRLLLYVAYMLSLVFILLFWTGHLVDDYFYVTCQYFPRPTWIYKLYMMNFLVIVGYAFSRILAKYKKTESNFQVKHLKFILLGAFLGVVIGMTNFLLSLGMKFYPVGHLGGITFTSIVSYAIIKYG